MRTSTVVAVIVVLLVIAGLAWWVMTQPAAAPATTENNTNTTATSTGTLTGTVEPTPSGSTAPTTVTVTHNASGFSPETVTIKKGGIVTFSNSGTSNMWVASNQHPTHTLYAGTAREDHCPDGTALAFDQCQNGNTYSFKFDKVGSWLYHNHSAASQLGTVIVVE